MKHIKAISIGIITTLLTGLIGTVYSNHRTVTLLEYEVSNLANKINNNFLNIEELKSRETSIKKKISLLESEQTKIYEKLDTKEYEINREYDKKIKELETQLLERKILEVEKNLKK